MTSTLHTKNRRNQLSRRLLFAAVASLATSGMMMQHGGTAQAATTPRATAATATTPAYGATNIADTNYPIPTGAYYVSNSGSDTNAGSLAAPFASVHKALSVAPAGATIVVRGGTYRESLGAIKKHVTIQAYPHEQVWVTGSVVATNFSTDSGYFSMPWSVSMCDTCYPSAALDPSYPAAGLPEQVFVDGAPLAQVTTQAALAPGTFYVDRAAGKIWLYDNPAGHSVEVTQLASAFTVSSAAAGTVIRGIGFEHWAAVYQSGTNVAAMISASNVTLDSDTFAWSSSRFLGVYGASDTVTNSTFVDNGMNGVTGNKINDFDFEHNEIAYSNYEHWDITPSPYAQIAGIKLTGVNDTMLRDNDIHDNASNGLWFDVLSTNQTIVGNKVLNNAGHGLTVEVSGHSIIAGNVVAMNGRDGLKISGANNVEVWNNTVVDNG
ncbi:MAG TPA: right-handed parallel beta-helix repeat-containing protein, partial [Acidimicrobiia bacterium]